MERGGGGVMGNVSMLSWNHSKVSGYLTLQISFFHHESRSFPKLKMMNQCSIEFFTMSKKAYQTASLGNTSILKTCDENHQHLVCMMAKWHFYQRLIWSLECNGCESTSARISSLVSAVLHSCVACICC